VKQRRILAACVALALFGLALAALARPGGGNTYGGGSSGSSGSSGSGGDDVAGILIEIGLWLCIEHPAVGVPVLLVGCVMFVAVRVVNKPGKAWDSAAAAAPAYGQTRVQKPLAAAAPSANEARPRARDELLAELERIRERDPEFSIVLFEDFLSALYAEVHAARGNGTLLLVAPYLADSAHQGLQRGRATRVEAVVIGSLKYLDVQVAPGDPRLRVEVEFQANYTEIEAGVPSTYYVVESWYLSRAASARSRPPKRAKVIGCPNCGAPLDRIVNATCGYCQAVVSTGDFDWRIEFVSVRVKERRPPALTSKVEERGTQRPTVVASNANQRFAELAQRDPAVSSRALRARVELIFSALQAGWNNHNLLVARGFLSDRSFETLGYWLEAYARAGLRNVTERAKVDGFELSRVLNDEYYDSITVRVFARSLDYTLNASGQVVSGSRSIERPYSEYWTLIRGSAVRGAPRLDPSCPNCGAPLDVNMAGSCNHCRAEVTSGNFDWVLSRIEQDDDY
jgi:predicted lipid-binding transport protein (Tim44 family)